MALVNGKPLFGFLTRPVGVIFPAHCDILAVQVGEQRVPPADKTILTSGIPAIGVTSKWTLSTSEGPYDPTLAVALNYNSSGVAEDQAANEVTKGPGATVTVMYGRDLLIGSAVTEDWLWTQGPACQLGSISTNNTYKVRGYLFLNLTLIKKYKTVSSLTVTANWTGGSGSIYQLWVESLIHCRSVNFASLKTLGGVTLENAGTMGWTYKSMASWGKGIGQPQTVTGETDSISPQAAFDVSLASEAYTVTAGSSLGFGGNADNVWTTSVGTGAD